MKKRILSIVLSFLLAFGQALPICAKQTHDATKRELYRAESARIEAEREIGELPLYDRYIVKLQSNDIKNAQNDVKNKIRTALPKAKASADLQVGEILSEKQIEKVDSFDLNKVPSYTTQEQAGNLLTVTISEKVDANTFAAAVENDAQVEYVQPDYALEPSAEKMNIDLIKNEKLSLDSYKIDTEIDIEVKEEADTEDEEVANPEAREQPTISQTVPIVAVIDSGIDITHSDLRGHILSGYDFVNDSALTYDSTKEYEYIHGTHIAGIIVQNAPDTQILPLKVFERGKAYTSDIIRAIEYAKQNGAKIVNMSFGGRDNNRALKEAMENSDMLFVCAAGNVRTDVEEMPVYPACFDIDNIISVASLNQDLGFSYYSNYGTISVDIAAIGRNVESMLAGGGYGCMSGTSQAAAQVSAGAAIAAKIGESDIKMSLIGSADRLLHLQNKVSEGRSLNIDNIINRITSDQIMEVEYEDDFDVHGYQMTPEESWELFSAVDVVDVAAGTATSYALRSDGTVWAWGSNQYCNLGSTPTMQYRSSPYIVNGLSDIVQISASGYYCYALASNGDVYGWGRNDYGLLGDTNASVLLPTLLQTGAKYVAAGDTNSVVVKNDGGITLMGDSQYFPDANVSEITNIEKAAVDRGQFALIRTDKTVLSWGRLVWMGSASGLYHNLTPYIQPNLNNVREVAIEYYETYMVTENNDLYRGDEYNCAPVLIGQGIKSVATKGEQIFRVYTNGRIQAYGYNDCYQLGAGPDVEQTFVFNYVPVLGVSNAKQVSTSGSHAIALCEDGSVWIWGNNSNGQLGLGHTDEITVPIHLNWGVDGRDGSEVSKAYILYENTVCVPSDFSRTNLFEFVAPETGTYIFEGFGSGYNQSGFPDAYFLTEIEANYSGTYSDRWYEGYVPDVAIDGNNVRYYGNSQFCFEKQLTAGSVYYILVNAAQAGNGYGVRVTNSERIMDMTGESVSEMEAEDMTHYDWNNSYTHASYNVMKEMGAYGGKALMAYGYYDDGYQYDDKLSDVSSVCMPTLTFNIRSSERQNYYFWVRAKVTNTGQDSLWFNGGYLDSYNYTNIGLNIGTDDAPWTWTKIGVRELPPGIHSFGICPRESYGMIDKVLVTTNVNYVPEHMPVYDYQVFEMEDGVNLPYSTIDSTAEYVINSDPFASAYRSVKAFVYSPSGNIDEVNAADLPVISFDAAIDEGGIYSIWIRSRKINSGSDLVWFAIDNGNYTNKGINTTSENEWEWTKLEESYMAEGNHTIKLIPREGGGIFDKIVVRKGIEKPTGGRYTAFEVENSSKNQYSENGQTANFVGEKNIDASNEHVMRAVAPHGTIMEIQEPANPVLQYTFDAEKNYGYKIWLRACVRDESDNSIWIAIDDETYRVVHFESGSGTFQWYMIEELPYISTGTHTIKLIPREKGGLYDKIVVTNQISAVLPDKFMINGIYDTTAKAGTLTPYEQPQLTARYELVEAEGATASWHGASDTALKAVVEGNSDKISDASVVPTPVLQIKADIEKDGMYSIYARVQAKSSAQDSMWYKIDKGNYRLIDLPVNEAENPNGWKWVKLETALLAAGKHIIGITPRESGCLIDKIVVGIGQNFEPDTDEAVYNESGPVDSVGLEYEQKSPEEDDPNFQNLTPPSINAVRMEILNFSKGIYRLTITNDDYIFDSRGSSFFFWEANNGTFSEVSPDYKSVVFTANSSTTDDNVYVYVELGDGLGQADKKKIFLKGSEE